MLNQLAATAHAWGPHMAGHPGGPGWWLIFPISFLVFLFGALGVATLYVVRRTRPPEPPQQQPSDATAA